MTQQLIFDKLKDTEEENRGFIVDRIDAYRDGVKVGYIKISYIPEIKWREHYKYAIQYQTNISGWCPNPETESEFKDPKTLQSWSWYCWHDNDLHASVLKMNEQELDDLFWKIEKFVAKEYKSVITRFKNYWLDKPHVDFIRVYEPYRRQGIGTALYLEAAKWMIERGYDFYSSTSMSEQAKGAWEKFFEQGLVKQVKAVGYPYKKRYCFIPEKLIQGTI